MQGPPSFLLKTSGWVILYRIRTAGISLTVIITSKQSIQLRLPQVVIVFQTLLSIQTLPCPIKWLVWSKKPSYLPCTNRATYSFSCVFIVRLLMHWMWLQRRLRCSKPGTHSKFSILDILLLARCSSFSAGVPVSDGTVVRLLQLRERYVRLEKPQRASRGTDAIKLKQR